MTRSKQLAMLYIALMELPLGCTSSSSDLEVAGLLHDTGAVVVSSEQQAQEFNFGEVLASGQELEHKFLLSNPTKYPIKLLKTISSIPCCSAIGPLPGSILPGKEVQVPVVLRTENKEGNLRVTFAIETDSIHIPAWRLGVSARLVPEWELERQGETLESLSMGQPGKFTYRIFCRRKGEVGCTLPNRLIATGPIKANFKNTGNDRNGIGGLTESYRDIDVEILPSSQPGQHRGEIVFHWLDGRTRNHIVAWDVRSVIKVVPSGVALKLSKAPVSITLTVAARASARKGP